LKSRRRAELAARALDVGELENPRSALPRLRRKLESLADALRYEDAARLRDRLAAIESVATDLETLDRLRALELCVVAPARESGFERLFFISQGRVAAARTAPKGGGRIELAAGLAAARRGEVSASSEETDELLVVAQFLRRPPPELRVLSFDDLARRSAA
jgi:DNA polymerase-3 subunit epsilon